MQKSLIEPPVDTIPGPVRRRDRNNAPDTPVDNSSTSTLIAFPGVSRSVPEWRKQLSQRVREVQEQRAREAAEAEAATRAAESVSCALPSGQLELVPDRDQAPLNPIVSKALKRVDRARRADQLSTGMTATATAPAREPAHEEVPQPDVITEAKPKLTIVNATTKENLAEEIAIKGDTETKAKPVRVISERVEDVALSYLETCLSVPVLSCDSRQDIAGFTRRTIAGTMDLVLVALMVSPVAAVIELSAADWADLRVIGLLAGIVTVTMFAYLTLSIALTGRTLAMRMLSLRTIDLRTGLIPTGGQAVKRAVSYIVSLAFFGLGLVYAFVDPDHRTVHDRFSNTIVIRD
jgi:uncharacterized RDD family membrane protein YckC